MYARRWPTFLAISVIAYAISTIFRFEKMEIASNKSSKQNRRNRDFISNAFWPGHVNNDRNSQKERLRMELGKNRSEEEAWDEGKDRTGEERSTNGNNDDYNKDGDTWTAVE
jgi:Ni/Co efflux regulator RcnB